LRLFAWRISDFGATTAALKGPEEGRYFMDRVVPRTEVPRLMTSLTSRALRRLRLGNICPYYTVVRVRPLRRRRTMVFLPPGEALRFKKPCARARLRFLG